MPRYPLEAPPELWEEWKLTVPRTYDRFGDRLLEFIRADLYCQREYGQGALELLVENEVIDSNVTEGEPDE